MTAFSQACEVGELQLAGARKGRFAGGFGAADAAAAAMP
jgi:hypothetical protein